MRTDSSVRGWFVSLAAAGLLLATGCGDGSDVPRASIPSPSGTGHVTRAPGQHREEPVNLVATDGEFRSPAQSDQELHPEVLISTSVGEFKVRLYWEQAPRTVANFLHNYVETGFYDQTLMHYVESGYLIAGGGYDAELREKATQPPIPCEADNGLSNKRGTIAMARHPAFVNSATSQFFLNLVDNPGLDHQPGAGNGINGYCVFGEVIEGMNVVDRIAHVPVHDKGELLNTPVTPVVIESVTRIK